MSDFKEAFIMVSTCEVIKNNGIIQYISKDGTLYATEDHLVWESRAGGQTWENICQLAPNSNTLIGILKDHFLRSPLVRKLRKNIGINNLVQLTTGTIIAQYDKIYRWEPGIDGLYAQPVYNLEANGISGPLKNGMCHDPSTDFVYFGEYNIKRPNAIRILKGYNDGREWDICYEFPRGQIRHVHGIYCDSFRKRLWICTGDNDSESGLYYTDDDFQTVKLFAGGDQSWRMVSLLITPDRLIWGTDAGQDAEAHIKNYIYVLDMNSGKREKVCCIDKPAYYSVFSEDGSMFIGTTFEPKIKRDVTPTADIWFSKDGYNWNILGSFQYKYAGRKYGTKYATIILPANCNLKETLIFSLLNTESYDFGLVKYEIPNK